VVEAAAEDSVLRDQARFWRAEAMARAGRPDQAEAEFAALFGSDGPDATAAWRDTARLRRLQCLVELRRWSDVLGEADRFLAERPEFPQVAEVHYARGRALASRALPDFAGARAAFEAAAAARPGSEVAARSRFMLGETYLHEKNYREAARAFHQVELLSGVPRWQAAALLEAGTAYDAMNQPEEAASAYRKLIESFPGEPGAAEARSRLAARK
jgi:TolA-binding protein